MWILTRAINEYNQNGEYFVTAWINHPTKDEIDIAITDEVIGLGNDLTDEQLDHIYENGGGRIAQEYEWYFLRELTKD